METKGITGSYRKLIRNMRKMHKTQWISTKDELPPENKKILIWLNEKPLIVVRVGHHYYNYSYISSPIGIDLECHWSEITSPEGEDNAT